VYIESLSQNYRSRDKTKRAGNGSAFALVLGKTKIYLKIIEII
jgi:hypothetical protein